MHTILYYKIDVEWNPSLHWQLRIRNPGLMASGEVGFVLFCFCFYLFLFYYIMTVVSLTRQAAWKQNTRGTKYYM